MAYNLTEAGNAVGMSKNGILKAIRRGAISASRDGAGWCIDPAELHRVYPAKVTEVTPANPADVLLEEVRGRLAAAEQTIDDLRRRLDREGEERRQLMALLADQRRSWWRFGR